MTHDKVEFDVETHTYKINGEVFQSATTWIKSHWPDFNPDNGFWHGGLNRRFTQHEWVEYAILEEIKGNGPVSKKNPDEYHYIRKLFGSSWEKELAARAGKKIPIRADEVLQIWEQNGNAAAEEGTRIHNLIEQAILEEIELLDYLDEVQVVGAMAFFKNLMNGLGYPEDFRCEEILYLKPAKIAGTADLVIRKGNKVTIVDWKTNKELTWDGYEKGLTNHTANLTNSSLQLYTLQLSLYGYMLEQQGYEVNKLILYHTRESKPYEITYEKELIESMLTEDNRL